MKPKLPPFETDPRFPSGPWTGFFLMPHTGAKRHPTSLTLSFADGAMSGEGADFVGPFSIKGKYSVEDGKCTWVKHYAGKHDVFYNGYNEGKGIWGMWDIPNPGGTAWKGGFHIWPEGMADPTRPALAEEADLPVAVGEDAEVEEALPVGTSP